MWLTSNPPTPYDALRSHHQTLIQTMIAACQAAHNGDLEALQHLLSEGVNLNANYDRHSLILGGAHP